SPAYRAVCRTWARPWARQSRGRSSFPTWLREIGPTRWPSWRWRSPASLASRQACCCRRSWSLPSALRPEDWPPSQRWRLRPRDEHGLLLSLTAACRGGAVRASNVRCSTASHPPGLDSCRHRHHHLRGERPRCCWSAGCGLDVGPLAELASCTFPKARCVLLNAERVLYSDVKGVLGSVAAFLSIDMRRWLGVLEFLYVSPARVLIACLVSLAAIFAVDISTPRSDYFAILY